MYNHQSVFWYTCELLFLCVSMSKIQWEWVLVSYEFIECFRPLFYMVVSRDAINFIGDRGSGANNKKMGLCSKKHKLLMSEEETGSHFTLNKILIQELLCLWINLVFNLLYVFFSCSSTLILIIVIWLLLFFYFFVQLKVPLHVKYISSRCFTWSLF